jgi:hypothetical protein
MALTAAITIESYLENIIFIKNLHILGKFYNIIV